MLMAAHSHGVPDSPLALSALNDISMLLPKFVTRQAVANAHLYSSVEFSCIISGTWKKDDTTVANSEDAFLEWFS